MSGTSETMEEGEAGEDVSSAPPLSPSRGVKPRAMSQMEPEVGEFEEDEEPGDDEVDGTKGDGSRNGNTSSKSIPVPITRALSESDVTVMPPMSLSSKSSAAASAISSSLPSAAVPAATHPLMRRSLFPTSAQLASLGLHMGRNRIVFTVSSLLRGSQSVEASVWLLPRDCKLVISDVDGTITRSDVLGQVLPSIGKDWSQPGVASLFDRIAKNGYQMMYLTSRAIGQASSTRGYIESVKQGEVSLPPGPVIMSPDRLLQSFTREVIRRAPQEFKISALMSVRALFPERYNPFYAGLGNRPTDYQSYKALSVPEARIFIINPKGEVQQEHRTTAYRTTYRALSDMADAAFPPLRAPATPCLAAVQGSAGSSISLGKGEEADTEFNSFNFWSRAKPVVNIEQDNID
jgi:phosphatidate phosphatase LPIN